MADLIIPIQEDLMDEVLEMLLAVKPILTVPDVSLDEHSQLFQEDIDTTPNLIENDIYYDSDGEFLII